VVEAIEDGLVTAAHDPNEGGLAAALAEMAFGADIGFQVDLTQVHPQPEVAMFAETPTRWVLETEDADELITRFEDADLHAQRIGETREGPLVFDHGGDRLAALDTDQAYEAWHEGLTESLEGRR